MIYRKPSGRLSTPPDPDLPPSLAGAEIGDEVLVDRILLNLVRTLCRERGISVGDRLLIEERTRNDVLVRDERGRSARLPHPYAFFVYTRAASGDDGG